MNNSDHSQQFRCGQVFLQARTDSTMPDVAEDLLCFFPNIWLVGWLVLVRGQGKNCWQGNVTSFRASPSFVYGSIFNWVGNTQWSVSLIRFMVSRSNSKRFRWIIKLSGKLLMQHLFSASTLPSQPPQWYLLSLLNPNLDGREKLDGRVKTTPTPPSPTSPQNKKKKTTYPSNISPCT